MTMAEKILARTSSKRSVLPNEYVTAKIDLLMGHDSSFYRGYELMMETGYDKVWDSNRIVVVVDHAFPAPNLTYAEIHKKIREYIRAQGIINFYDGGTGICHQVFSEKGHALPGLLIVGGDSHSTTYGAFGAAACGIGFSEVAYVMAKGYLWFKVPDTKKFVLNGKLPQGTSAKDVILKIAGQYGAEFAQYKSIEFVGPAAKDLSIDQRMTICNMGVEIGAKFAFFEADDKTLTFLKTRIRQSLEYFASDSDANYQAVYEMDVSSLEPQIACPHNVDNVKPISAIEEVKIQQAFIGSCTNGRREDIERAAVILKGRKIHPETRLLVIPASHEIYLQIVKSGALQTFLEAGAVLATPGCGPCGGTHAGVLAAGEIAISSSNRNFKARMGSRDSQIYLASAETVAASAIEGKITDPRKYLN